MSILNADKEEIWKDIKNFEGKYQVSNFGRVKSLDRCVYQYNGNKTIKRNIQENIMSFYTCGSRLRVSLRDDEYRSKNYSVDRLVANTFIPNPNNYKYVVHLDNDNKNNCVDNLVWSLSPNKQPDIDKLIVEAKEYNDGVELRRCNQWLYNQIQKRGLIPVIFPNSHKGHNKWTLNEVLKVANSCENYTVFRTKYMGAYQKVLSEGWQEYLPFTPKNILIDKIYKVYVYLFENENAYYVGLTRTNKRDSDHRSGKSYSAVYDFANQKGVNIPTPIILESELTQEQAREKEHIWDVYYHTKGMIRLNKAKTGKYSSSIGGNYRQEYSLNACVKRLKKYKNRSEARKKDPNTVGWMLHNHPKELEDILPNRQIKWTYEICKLEASKYKSAYDFRKGSSGAYCASWNNGWLWDFFEPTRKPIGYYDNIDNIKESASKYKTRREFSEKCRTAYDNAVKYGIIDELFKRNKNQHI